MPPELYLAPQRYLRRERMQCTPLQNSQRPGLDGVLDHGILLVPYPLLVRSDHRFQGNVLGPEICFRGAHLRGRTEYGPPSPFPPTNVAQRAMLAMNAYFQEQPTIYCQSEMQMGI